MNNEPSLVLTWYNSTALNSSLRFSSRRSMSYLTLGINYPPSVPVNLVNLNPTSNTKSTSTHELNLA